MENKPDYEQLYYDAIYENRKLKQKIEELENARYKYLQNKKECRFTKIYSNSNGKEEKWERKKEIMTI